MPLGESYAVLESYYRRRKPVWHDSGLMLILAVLDCGRLSEPLNPSAFSPLPFMGLALVFWAISSSFHPLPTPAWTTPDSIHWTFLPLV
jgi:hypothetical protein